MPTEHATGAPVAVLLDTRTVPASARRETFRAAMIEVSGATHVELDDVPGGVSGRMAVYDLGRSRIFLAESTGITMRRHRSAARQASPDAVAIAVHGAGVGRHQVGSHQRLVRRGQLMVVDVTRPFEFAWSGWGSSSSLQVPLDDLAITPDVAQRATTRLPSSPLYGLVSAYLTELATNAERLSAGTGAAILGDASHHLVRALISSAGDDARRARDVVEQSLLSQVRVHVHQHLRDPSLDSTSVAAALSVSRRHLQRVCAAAGFSLEQHVIGRRLEGAKQELATASGRRRPIAAVALSWGFKDPTHFARRFRAAYGLTPSEWRAEASDDHG